MAPYIARAFELYATGTNSLNDIADILYDEGLRTSTGKKVRCGHFQRMVNNPFYSGIMLRDGKYYQGKHQPIISQELFQKVKNVIENKNRPRLQKKFFPLRGFMKCDNCGCALTASLKKGHHYYYCTNRKEKCDEHKTYMREMYLYDKFADILDKIAFSERKIELMYLAAQEKLGLDSAYTEKVLENLRNELQALTVRESRPGVHPVGYLSEKRMDRKCHAIIDPDRGPIIKKMFEKVAYEKWSGYKVYNWLKFEINFKTAKGNKGLTIGNIYQLLQNPFYYGIFEFPVKSGNWYTGKHEPLITKELFEMVQSQVKSHTMPTINKEFAFTRLMVCGLCGSGITADEKFKKLKNGGMNRHVYYKCTKVRDRNCQCGYISEEDLVKQFEKLMDTISLDEIGIKEKIKDEVTRFKKFNQIVLGNKEKVEVGEIDIRNYAKYILKDGTDGEKRELLGCLRGKIVLKDKIISLE